ncbi:DegT/DnrJ/EryC1/StrS aminotransferase family protein [Clostridium cochlearium]|uniref:Spore coat polysaccharide biosynthesis protein spsC n=1 Tax=Clostridium cochlearium TaxID=1494 RepID=A0A2X2WDC7_CLOCO|nr:DegT/DnrJ/EryC1/StrS aminotransferase family protein [Clostridium cochlearium]MBV1817844.1 DegT/DnrJ/EryC1/StrS aminotransferase family protein [Bacteroidales bacterium MSK.15.36]MBU5269041.1 DegT/DnrJ/EryC1/StrS aminotransferase family protein [Clostridium cochlearium]MCG4570674.1 DegT/DnrJ/EryC1/StrS aminotransferase family protein [Clostridium cochlearium]MCG4579450.1 DegT/DnrJ/EryC1/StrS aminotransferase family protein [Clostridium cochlearium]MCR1970370.1 DegT/DnrJ/EryC1/StrS aminotran
MSKKIPFSPPDITREEIDEVVKVLESGWITSGPKVAEFESAMANYCNTNHALAVASATSGMELILKVFDIKKGDEIITTPYTYTSTSNIILHRGIKPTFVDVKKDSFLIDIDKIEKAITPKTKAIITVDFAGVPVDYDKVREVLKKLGREDIILISDSAHSYGASYKGKKVGGQFDFHVFSFHAVKNLTTAEGGGVTYNDNNFKGKEDLIKEFKYTSLNGQSKDALSKMKAGAWRYDVLTDGFKCNMTDMQAALGVVQMKRYESLLEKRRAIFNVYSSKLKNKDWAIIPFDKNEEMETSYHLYPLRIKGFEEEDRTSVIEELANKDIATNVHFIPLPMFTVYKNLGYKIEDYPNAYNQYKNEISVPVYSTLTLEDAEYVIDELIKAVEKRL